MSVNYASRVRMTTACLNGQTHIYPLKKRFKMVGSTPTFFDIGGSGPGTAPSAASDGAGVLDGDRNYYAVYVDTVNPWQSNPSPVGAVTGLSSNKVLVTLTTIASGAPSRCNYIDLYRSVVNGSFFYRVARIAKTTPLTYSDNNSDASILSNEVLESDNDAPPTLELCHVHGAFIFGSIGSAAYWCKANRSEQWPPLNTDEVAHEGETSDITAWASVGGTVIVFKERGLYAWSFVYNPSPVYGDGANSMVFARRGALNERCVINVGETVFSMDRDGIYALAGIGAAADLTSRLGDKFEGIWSRINFAYASKFSAARSGPLVYWSVALDSDTECNYILALDWRSVLGRKGPRWWLFQTHHPLRDLCNMDLGSAPGITGYAKKEIAVAMDGPGTIMVMDWLGSDGVPSDLVSVGTIAGVETSGGVTRIERGGSDLWVDNLDGSRTIARSYVRFFLNGAWSTPYYIASTVLGNHILFNLSVNITSQLEVGVPFVIGQIKAEYEFPQNAFGDPHTLKKLLGVHMVFTPRPIAFGCGVHIEADNRGYQAMVTTDDVGMFEAAAGEDRQQVRMGGEPDTEGGRGVVNLPGVAIPMNRVRLKLSLELTQQPVEIISVSPVAESADGGR
jgi:hypothetical protein